MPERSRGVVVLLSDPETGELNCNACLVCMKQCPVHAINVEQIKDPETKEPFDEAGKLVYQKAFRKGLAWIPAGHILRMSPPLIMDEKYAGLGLDMIEESITEVEKAFGYH